MLRLDRPLVADELRVMLLRMKDNFKRHGNLVAPEVHDQQSSSGGGGLVEEAAPMCDVFVAPAISGIVQSTPDTALVQANLVRAPGSTRSPRLGTGRPRWSRSVVPSYSFRKSPLCCRMGTTSVKKKSEPSG